MQPRPPTKEGSTIALCDARPELQLYSEPLASAKWKSMSLPKAGDTVKISMLNGETIEGVVEWIDGNGAWIKSAQRSRWVPLEALEPPPSPTEPVTKQD